MRIAFKPITRTTNLTPAGLVSNILAELNTPRYIIIRQAPHYLEFKRNKWEIRSSDGAFLGVDGGAFKLDTGLNNVVFSFYISLTYELIASAVAIFFALTQDITILIFLLLFG